MPVLKHQTYPPTGLCDTRLCGGAGMIYRAKYHTLGGLQTTEIYIFLTVLAAGKPTIEVSANSVSGEGRPSGSWCLLTVSSRSGRGRATLYDLFDSSTNPIHEGSVLMI